MLIEVKSTSLAADMVIVVFFLTCYREGSHNVFISYLVQDGKHGKVITIYNFPGLLANFP